LFFIHTPNSPAQKKLSVQFITLFRQQFWNREIDLMNFTGKPGFVSVNQPFLSESKLKGFAINGVLCLFTAALIR
jgi:hypothetical protein